MASDEILFDQLRKILQPVKGYDENKMFSGICFLLNSNMVYGILKGGLIVGVWPANHEDALQLPHIKEFVPDLIIQPLESVPIAEAA